MIKRYLKTHYIIWIAAILTLVIGFTKRRETLDFNVHDTYYVIAKNQLYNGIAMYFGIVGLLYWLYYKVGKKTLRWLDIVYMVLMFLGVLGFIVIPLFNMKRVYYTNTSIVSDKNAVILISIAQLILMINLTIALFKKRSYP
ncbi:hypothetical protein GCM10011344_03470 [Dokdonia pacifica]|uniref:Uncharacterized protein n=1 Tax=Dokdonia pacifica TaxID=1627892 RepID=A0A238ZH77_9FLAO|nr:hypothetical protein [Dokdonia pacifica]GGG06300.1 hypothetical protein GCM10011344_03470 [Dokdonia pacifica]SNR82391.1 hypothetical protein SAMN06265376_103208 [Dokdonia pacifica]